MNHILYFLGTICVTLLITVLAARRGTSRGALYTANGSLSPVQNALAITGDYISAGTILGFVGLYFTSGVDSAIYMLAPLAGLCLMLVLIVGPLRRMGQFTLGDVMTSRLPDPRLRMLTGVFTVVICFLYLISQLVGAGALISIVFGFPFVASVMITAALMAIYVVFGGMLAASWVQIIKASMLMACVITLSALCIHSLGGVGKLYAAPAVAARAGKLFGFGTMKLGLYGALSLSVAQVLGMMGMPHLLVRFFTVPDAAAARKSLVIGVSLVGVTMGAVFFIICPAAIAFVADNPALAAPGGGTVGGPNMITMHLSRLVGGEALFGLMSAVVLATILAVVAGLTITISTAVSHDLIGGSHRAERLSATREIAVFRLAAILTAVAAGGVATMMQQQNIALLTIMGFTVASSTTFPLLILSIYWRGLTVAGGLAGGLTGLVTSVAGIVMGPTVWVKTLGHATLLSSDYPALLTAPLALFVTWAVSRATANTGPTATPALVPQPAGSMH